MPQTRPSRKDMDIVYTHTYIYIYIHIYLDSAIKRSRQQRSNAEVVMPLICKKLLVHQPKSTVLPLHEAGVPWGDLRGWPVVIGGI